MRRAIGDAADVVVNAEDLLDHDDTWTIATRWQCEVGVELAAVEGFDCGHEPQITQTTQIYRFDPSYTTVEFVIRNLWYNVKGRFSVLEGVIVLDEEDIRRSSVTANIKARSIDTGNKRRDAHLQSADFLDADNFPDIEFTSTRVARGKDRDSIDLEGNLTFKGKS